MAEISPVGCVKEIGKCILTQCIQPPVKRHFDYWWCFENNVKALKHGVRDLERQKHDLEKRKNEALQDAKIIIRWVEEWLKDASQKLDEGKTISSQCDNIPEAWNITSRYSMGKTAKKKSEEIEELVKDGNFKEIADDGQRTFTCHSWTRDFQSRKRIEKEIIDNLKNSNVSMIGICGMGGVGKTTMAERIGERVNKDGVFDEVVMVTVSKQNEMVKIQEDIAKSLKLKFDDRDMPADKLRRRLMDSKRKLIIFDDVWERLKFEDLGIPIKSESDRCKVLLTSRSQDTCKGIQNIKVFELKTLDEKEAWELFKERAGECVEYANLVYVAKAVAHKCKRLPIALVTVGTALQNVTDKPRWENARSQLSNLTDFPEVLKDVYMPLKLSYDYLANDNEKELFLLCCLFPEDYDIPVELLTFYSMGLRLFDGIRSIEDARNKTHELVGRLKSRFLLTDSLKKLHVNMHDVVRDVAIYIGSKEIGSKERNGFLKILNKTSIESSDDAKCNWMSVDISNKQMGIPNALLFPNLRLLMLLKPSSREISSISFQGMENLEVLSFPSTWVGSLPPTLGLLKELQTLCLFECEVESISIIGKLTSLQIFRCNGCKNITQLPEEIGELKCLRLLELNGCSNLRSIPFGILSKLVRLEELKIQESFDGWDSWEAEENGKETKNASITELESLCKLTCLEIEISDSKLAAKKISLPELDKYRIHIGLINDRPEETDYERVMKLNLPKDIGAVGDWIQMLVTKSECLYLKEDGSGKNIKLAETGNLRNLELREYSGIKKLVKTKHRESGTVFRFLERLNLYKLDKLEEICDGTIILNQNGSLRNLKSVEIESCIKLRYLFSVSVARKCLLQLEVLVIKDCDAMEQVFRNEMRDEDTDGGIEFKRLKKLGLKSLPNLTAFCEGVETIKLPQLTEILIAYLPKLNGGRPRDSETPSDDKNPFRFLCSPKGNCRTMNRNPEKGKAPKIG